MKNILILVIIISAVLAGMMLIQGTNSSGVVYWEGHGSGNLPCTGNEHWTITKANDTTFTTFTAFGETVDMVKQGNGSWDADTNVYIPVDPNYHDAFASYDGDLIGDAQVQLSSCDGAPVPTPTPTDQPPTDTPTATPTEQPPTDTSTATPTEQPPTDTPTSTPTGTLTPTDTPTMTPTGTLTPTDTPTMTPTEYYTPTNTPEITLTATPKPPYAAFADGKVSYPGYKISTMYVNDEAYSIYNGVKAENGRLLLPSKEKAGALYQNQVWIHRAWNSGWLILDKGDVVDFVTSSGIKHSYMITGSTKHPYGTYFNDGSLHIVTCYGGDSGNWEGVEVYNLKLIEEKRE